MYQPCNKVLSISSIKCDHLKDATNINRENEECIPAATSGVILIQVWMKGLVYKDTEELCP